MENHEKHWKKLILILLIIKTWQFADITQFSDAHFVCFLFLLNKLCFCFVSNMADRFDWLLQWKDGQPEMGWSDYLAYLVPWIANKSAGSLVDAVPCNIDEKTPYMTG